MRYSIVTAGAEYWLRPEVLLSATAFRRWTAGMTVADFRNLLAFLEALPAPAPSLERNLDARGLGVDRSAVVGIHLHRSVDVVVSILAVHKAGGAYLPLDPAYPGDRLAYMVEDSGIKALLADGEIAAVAPVPKPLQKPHPPLFQPFASSEQSIRWCAREGVTAIPCAPATRRRSDQS